MIKGCKKSVIMVNGDGNSLFETAYFILKNDLCQRTCGEDDMINEANRIIEERMIFPIENDKKGRKKKGDKKCGRVVIPFAAGTAIGSAVGLLWLFL